MHKSGTVTVLADGPRLYDVAAPFHPPCRWPEFAHRLDPGDTAPNGIYEAVRNLLIYAQMDGAKVGTEQWNPFSQWIRSGDRVVIKPNWVRHFNPNARGSFSSVVTHAAVIRAVCDYALLATGPEGSVVIADAPQHDCDFGVLCACTGIDKLQEHYGRLKRPVEIRDLRQEAVVFEDGVVTERIKLKGDPEGYTQIDLRSASAFVDAPQSARRLRGADYDERETIRHHCGGHHRYLLSNTILDADCIINLPKIKSHKKAGITCCLKNLVGINGNKNYLPHHTTGFPGRGGDEFARLTVYTWTRRKAVEWARKRLAAGKSVKLIRSARNIESRTHKKDGIRSGNWYGNDTIWRTVVDLNTILQYADRSGRLHAEPYSGRRVIHLAEGLVAGGGEGPLAPLDVPAGLLMCSDDPVLLDATAAMLVGFDWCHIPSVFHARYRSTRPLTRGADWSQPVVRLIKDGRKREYSIQECPVLVSLPPHFGWLGHIEREGLTEIVHATGMAG